jgi:glycosyltransferase involved in cell wall biosynthesis
VQRKSVLFISPQPFFQWRGSPIRVKFNLLALVSAGYDVHLLTLPVGDDLPLEGVTVHRVANPFRVKQVPIGPNGWKLFFDLLLLWRGFRLCRRHRFAVVHGVEEAGLIAAVLARCCGAGAIFERHSDPRSYRAGPLKNGLLWIYAQVEKTSARLADAVIGTGAGLVEQVDAMRTGTPALHIPDIPSSLQDAGAADRQAIRDEWQAAPEEVVLLYVGSFAVYQGVDLLFAAIPELVQQAPAARFVIIGGSDAEIAARRRELEAQGVAGRVRFQGKVDPDQLPRYLVAADVLLSTRISGMNMPLKVLDYLKAGRPVAATDVPANRLLLDEQTAVFAPVEPAGFARHLAALVMDPERRARLGGEGRRRYERDFTFEHHKDRLAACYRLVGERRAATLDRSKQP